MIQLTAYQLACGYVQQCDYKWTSHDSAFVRLQLRRDQFGRHYHVSAFEHNGRGLLESHSRQTLQDARKIYRVLDKKYRLAE